MAAAIARIQGAGAEAGGVRPEPGGDQLLEWSEPVNALRVDKGLERKKEVGLVSRQGQGGGAKPRLSKEQKQELKESLRKESDFYTLGRIRNLVQERYGVSYGKRQTQAPAQATGHVLLQAPAARPPPAGGCPGQAQGKAAGGGRRAGHERQGLGEDLHWVCRREQPAAAG